ncbi:DUF732 domain-containing protein [Mycobacterium sp. MAA66]|uniref:DUF732 domain-containing protein n=1 Tax=Mycobacterium sp. MAA66 TaxID=3156297 RepID=UPI00351868C7
MSTRLLATMVAVTAMVCAPLAHADPPDAKYLAALSANGIQGDPGQLVADGHSACDAYGGIGMTGFILGLRARGMSAEQAGNLVADGIRAYCPEKGPWGPL